MKAIKIFLRQFSDITVILLLALAVGGGIIRAFEGSEDVADSFIILLILLLNGIFGAVQEYRAEMILGDSVNDRPTPLQKRLSHTGVRLCFLCVALCACIFLFGLIRGENTKDMLVTSVSLAVAAIPEGLPVIVTIMLSKGICSLKAEGVQIRRLSSAEGLGQVEVLFMRLERLENKELIRGAGIRLIDIKEKRAFVKFKRKNCIIGVIGEGEEDIPLMRYADIAGTFKENKELYKYAHIIFENEKSIGTSIKTGRKIFDNLKKSIHFLVSCNIGELITIFAAMVFGSPLPLLGSHLLMVNLVTDCLPVVAMALEPCSKSIMKRQPKPNIIFTSGFMSLLLFEGIVIGGVSLAAFAFGCIYAGIKTGRTMAFCTLCMSQLFHGFNMREGRLFENVFLNLSFLAGVVIVFGVVQMPVSLLFGFASLSGGLWFDAVLLSLLPFMLFGIIKGFKI